MVTIDDYLVRLEEDRGTLRYFENAPGGVCRIELWFPSALDIKAHVLDKKTFDMMSDVEKQDVVLQLLQWHYAEQAKEMEPGEV